MKKKNIYTRMNYRDFYKKEQALAGRRSLAENVDLSKIPPDLLKGVEVELEHTPSAGKKLQDASPADIKKALETAIDHHKEDKNYYKKLAKVGLEEDGSTGMEGGFEECGKEECQRYGGLTPLQPVTALDVPSRIRPVSIVNLMNPAMAFGNKTQSDPSQAVGSVADDKETITAAGEADQSMASKSVGGTIVPSKGQEQGGPNTKGNIAGTPKEVAGRGGVGQKGPNTTGTCGGTPKSAEIGLKGTDIIHGGMGVATGKKEHPLAKHMDGDEDDEDMSSECGSTPGVNRYEEEKEEEKDDSPLITINGGTVDQDDLKNGGEGEEEEVPLDTQYDSSQGEEPEDSGEEEEEEGEDVAINLQENIKKMIRNVILEVVAENFDDKDISAGARDEIDNIRKNYGVKDVSKDAEELAKNISKFNLKKNPGHYKKNEIADSKMSVLDDIVKDVYRMAGKKISDAQPGVLEKVVAAMFKKQYGKEPDQQAVVDAIKRNSPMQRENRFAAMHPDDQSAQDPYGQYSMMAGDNNEPIHLDIEKLKDVEVDGVDSADYPDFTDAYVVSAVYPVTEKPKGPHDWRELSDEEIDWLNDEHPEVAQQAAHGQMQGAGDAAHDAAKDRESGLEEKAPAGQEDWILANKEQFKKQYGKDYEKFLYGHAWNREKGKAEGIREGKKAPKKFKKSGTLQKEAAFISRKINEGRELTEDEKHTIKEIVLSKAVRMKEEMDDKGWEHAAEGQQAMLDAFAEDTVKYRSAEDTVEDLVDSIAVSAEDHLGMRHIDYDHIEEMVRQWMQKYPAKY